MLVLLDATYVMVCRMGEPSGGGSGSSCPGGEAAWLDGAHSVWKESDVVMKCNHRISTYLVWPRNMEQ